MRFSCRCLVLALASSLAPACSEDFCAAAANCDTSTTGSTTDVSTTGTPPTTGNTEGGELGTHSEKCGPDDGGAVEFRIDLASRACDATWPEGQAKLQITLYTSIGTLAVGSYPLDGGQGSALYDDGVEKVGDAGTVTISEVTADGLVGTYSITLSDDTVVTGSFDSLYCPVDLICG